MTEILSHAQIWGALDALGARYGLTPSGLAKKAGLDPTTFNRSKRATPSGRHRWPSTESIAKVLQATGAGLDEFMSLVSESRAPAAARAARPLIGLAAARSAEAFDAMGYAAGAGWDEIDLFADMDENSYALEVESDALEPLYRDGAILLVSPTTPARKGDHVLVKTAAGELLARELKRQTARTVELRAARAGENDLVLAKEDVRWLARILWASQ